MTHAVPRDKIRGLFHAFIEPVFPLRSISTLLLAVGVATCADGPNPAGQPSAPQPGPRRIARIGFEPVFSKQALAAAAHLADFDLTFDHVRVVIVRPVSDTVKDTTIAFVPGQSDVTLDLTVAVHDVGESFDAAIDYTNPSGVVFHGTFFHRSWGSGGVHCFACSTTSPWD